MFSEYASRFLAQSQSRISFRHPEESPRNPLERHRRQDQNGTRNAAGSRYQQRPGAAGSTFSQFPFASRAIATQQAPLFYSATDEFREEDDEQEHEREVADFYALQRSRRQFVSKPLDESSEIEDEGGRDSGLQENGDSRDLDERGNPLGGIRSSWQGDQKAGRGRKPMSSMDELNESRLEGEHNKDKMYNIGLESRVIDDGSPPRDLMAEMPDDDEDEDPPSIQQFRKAPQIPLSPYLPYETDHDTRRDRPPPPESEASTVPPTVGLIEPEATRHDVFWGHLYLISLISLLSTFLLVYLHTAAPTSKKPLGDTVYSTIHASFYLLAVDTVVAVIVSLLWLALLRNYVRPLAYTILVAVPVILFAFTLYPFISSFQHTQGEAGWVQDRLMRWLSSFPAIMALIWVYGVWKGRHAFGKAIGVLEFACRILSENPPLLLLGFGTLSGVVIWTWVWMGMFTRVFLSGHSGARYFIIDVGAWWLGAFFVFVYLWTLSVGSGIQRATTAATVSQWYFHRKAAPQPPSSQVVSAALSHAGTTLFGTICLSTLLTLLARLPVLLLPKRLISFVGFFSYTILPSSVLILTHPTTLTYSAIHSQSLSSSANAVSTLAFMSSSNRLQSRNRSTFLRTSSIQPYNLALLLLSSTRLMAATAFGFGAWVNTARKLAIAEASPTIRGSLYGYIVGMIAGAIGWAVLGAMEGVLTGIVDAVVVCWASEMRGGEVKYCREAGILLGDGGEVRDDVEEQAGLMR